ncbi:hypothetical protein ATANTOWER_009331, partial [Ataeniobius toweri]|nr:hypothetical protein [Ataeniobius toweri]
IYFEKVISHHLHAPSTFKPVGLNQWKWQRHRGPTGRQRCQRNDDVGYRTPNTGGNTTLAEHDGQTKKKVVIVTSFGQM